MLEKTKLELHPLAKAYPELKEKEYKKLKEDIRDIGYLQKPIILVDGKIFDGWHRYKACLELGIKPRFEEMKLSQDMLGKALTNYNKSYRKLTSVQKACVTIELEPIFKEETKKRQKCGIINLKRGSISSDAPVVSETDTTGKGIKARDLAAKAVGGVDHNLVSKVKQLRDKSQNKFEKAKNGKLTEHDIDEFLGKPPKLKPSSKVSILPTLVDYENYNELSRFGRMYSRVVKLPYREDFIERLTKEEREAVMGLLKESLDKKSAEAASKHKLTKEQVFQVASIPVDNQYELIQKFVEVNKKYEEEFNKFKNHIHEFIEANSFVNGVLDAVKKM